MSSLKILGLFSVTVSPSAEMTREMLEAADRLEFERAAYLRDQIAKLRADGGAAPGKRGLKARKRRSGK